MHIVYMLPGLAIGGGVNVVLEHAERLANRGHRITVLSTEQVPSITWRTADGVQISSIHSVEDLVQTFSAAPDVLVATGWQTVYEIAWRRLPARSYSYFVQAHEPDFYPADSYEADLARLSYALPFNYVSEARWLVEKLSDSYGHKALYARNGLTNHFHRQAKPIAPRGNRVRILLEGPLGNPRKRMDDAFLAVQELDAEVWLVTSGGELAPWQRPDRVFRSVPLSLMPSIYSSCDIMVKLSSVEGMFGPPLEMMSQGGVAVTSDVEGHEEFMVDGLNGLVVPVGDWRGAREAVRKLMGDRALLASMGARARATASQFQWGPTIDLVEEWFEGLSEAADPTQADEIFERARLGTRVHMQRTWHVGSLDGPQLFHSRLVRAPAEITAAGMLVVEASGWLASPEPGDTWTLDGADAPSVLMTSWGERPDVLASLPAFASATGFSLRILILEGDEESRCIAFSSLSGLKTALLLDEASVCADVTNAAYLDAYDILPLSEISHPVSADTEVWLELSTLKGEVPRIMVRRQDADGEVQFLDVEIARLLDNLGCSTYRAAGLSLQRFLGDVSAQLYVGSGSGLVEAWWCADE